MDLSSSAAGEKPAQEADPHSSSQQSTVTGPLPNPNSDGVNEAKPSPPETQGSSVNPTCPTDTTSTSNEEKRDDKLQPAGASEHPQASTANTTEQNTQNTKSDQEQGEEKEKGAMTALPETSSTKPGEEEMEMSGPSKMSAPEASAHEQQLSKQEKVAEQQTVLPSNPNPPPEAVKEIVPVESQKVQESTREPAEQTDTPIGKEADSTVVTEPKTHSESTTKVESESTATPRIDVPTVADSLQETAPVPAPKQQHEPISVSKQDPPSDLSPAVATESVVIPKKAAEVVPDLKPDSESVSDMDVVSTAVATPEQVSAPAPAPKQLAESDPKDKPMHKAVSSPEPMKEPSPVSVPEAVSTSKPVTESTPDTETAVKSVPVPVPEPMITKPTPVSPLEPESATQPTLMDSIVSDSTPAPSVGLPGPPPTRPLDHPSSSLPAPASVSFPRMTRGVVEKISTKVQEQTATTKDTEKPPGPAQSTAKEGAGEKSMDVPEKLPGKEQTTAPLPTDPEKETKTDSEKPPKEAKAAEVQSSDSSTPNEGAGKDKESHEQKVPVVAAPSMEDSVDSRGAPSSKNSNAESVKTGSSEEPMETEMIAEKTAAGVPFISEDSSKDRPPLDFKPFSHYTQDGKLIDKDTDEGKPAEIKSPQEPSNSVLSVSGAVSTAVSVSNEVSMSVDDNSFPGASELSESTPSAVVGPQPETTSQFQGQFMDFLKGNDNATQHSFKGSEGGDSQSVTADGVAKVGGEVTAQEENSQSGTPSRGRGGRRGRGRGRRNVNTTDGTSQHTIDETSNMSGQGDPQKRSARKRKPKDAEGGEVKDESLKESPKRSTETNFPADKLFEYQWPQIEKNAEWFFLQEHLSDFLGVNSFKRKYPDLTRRGIGMDERNFLQESKVVSEMQCDLGLTALKSDQVYELLLRDFPEKYQEYAEVLHAREQERMKDKNKNTSEVVKPDKNPVVDVVTKAVRSAAEFNAQFMRERREERRAYFDLQTHEIHYPLSTLKKLPPSATKVDAYPVALIPGQFQEYYRKYTPQQLKYFPLNTASYDPPRHLKTIYANPADKYESELDSQSASSQGDAEDGSSSSGSSSGSGSDSDSSSDGEEEAPTPAPAPPPSSTKKNARTPRGKKAQVVKDVNAICNICQGSSEKNKIGEAEELVKCSECGRHGHPSCLELTEEMIPNIKTYPWQCMECKTCVECMDPYDEDKMMFCDHCDRGYHTFCVGLRSIPTGRWECPSCRPDPPSKRRKR